MTLPLVERLRRFADNETRDEAARAIEQLAGALREIVSRTNSLTWHRTSIDVNKIARSALARLGEGKP